MIEVFGQKGTPEYEAAISLSEAIARLWPGIEESPEEDDDIKIAANVKISGYPVNDIDVVVCGRLKPGRRFVARRPLRDSEGKRVIGKPINVSNFVVAIEVKDHDAHSVEVTGDNVDVKYSRGGPVKWKSATEQNVKQVHSIQGYMRDFGADLFVHRCLMMRGLDNVSVAGALPRSFTGEEFIAELASTSTPRLWRSGSSYTFSSGSREKIERALEASIFRSIVPSTLDRGRMDRIAARSSRVDQLLPDVGDKLVQLRGHGGTGKTVMLLQVAWRKYRDTGQRSLVLTYNHALAADIRRLLALMGIPASVEEGGISVETVMSFMFRWFSRLRLLEEKEPDYEEYDALCKSVVEMLSAGAISSDDIKQVIEADPDRFDYDIVMVDEAQDWPENEVELLKSLYEPTSLCLADGVDQLVRGKRVRWGRGVKRDDQLVVSLSRCLRMKRNLAIFANALARDAGLGWDVVPSDEAGGGRIIVLRGSYADYPALHEKLLEGAVEAQNAEIDYLFCVPPSRVLRSGSGRTSQLGAWLRESGHEVWDAVDENTRRDFPRSKRAYRVVQYASCRGLEGWVVACEALEDFWQERYEARLKEGQAGGEQGAYQDLEEIASHAAWRWTMIPLTRPIDTLVITIADDQSELSKCIHRVAEKYPDIVEFLDNDI